MSDETETWCDYQTGAKHPCPRPARIVRSLTGEHPYRLCAEHAEEDAENLELDDDARAYTDRRIAR